MLSISKTYKGLTVTMKIGGFEAFDLIICLLLAAVSNLVLGRTALAPLFIIVFPTAALVALYLVKRGKPEGYVFHLLKYILTPGHYSTAYFSEDEEKRRRRII